MNRSFVRSGPLDARGSFWPTIRPRLRTHRECAVNQNECLDVCQSLPLPRRSVLLTGTKCMCGRLSACGSPGKGLEPALGHVMQQGRALLQGKVHLRREAAANALLAPFAHIRRRSCAGRR